MDWRLDGVGTTGISSLLLILLLITHHITSQVSEIKSSSVIMVA